MARLSELWTEYQSVVKQANADKTPKKEKKIIPPETEKQLKEAEEASPPKLFWRLLLLGLIIICLIAFYMDPEYSLFLQEPGSIIIIFFTWFLGTPAAVMIVSYIVKWISYNKAQGRKYYLQEQIRSIEHDNAIIDNEIQAHNSREKDRLAKKVAIATEVKNYAKSIEHFDQIFSTGNIEEIENELLALYKFLNVFPSFSLASTFLFKSIDYNNDVIVTDNCISITTSKNATWKALEKSLSYSWVVQLVFHSSKRQIEGMLSEMCYELALKSLQARPIIVQAELLPNIRSAETEKEKQTYQQITAPEFHFSELDLSSKKALLRKVLQNQQVMQKTKGLVQKSIPQPSHDAIPSKDSLCRYFLGRREGDDTDLWLWDSNASIIHESPYAIVHATPYSDFTNIGAEKRYTIPESDAYGLPITKIYENAFEKVPHLEVLSIPKNINFISEYIFCPQATPDIIHVYYQDTYSQWKNIFLHNNWADTQTGAVVIVHCTDISFVN